MTTPDTTHPCQSCGSELGAERWALVPEDGDHFVLHAAARFCGRCFRAGLQAVPAGELIEASVESFASPRAAALQAAITYHAASDIGFGSVGDVLATADKFAAWLDQ